MSGFQAVHILLTRGRPATTPPSRSAPATCLSFPTSPLPIRSRCRFPARRCSTTSMRRSTPEDLPAASLEEEFPGIRRMILEHHLRYTFVRYRRALRRVDRLLRRQHLALQDCRPANPPTRSGNASCARCALSAACRATCAPPSRCRLERAGGVFALVRLLRTGPAPVRHRLSQPGRPRRLHRLFADPLPAGRRTGPGRHAGVQRRARENGGDPDGVVNPSTPWRDNFCERRGFPVAQCPGRHRPSGPGHPAGPVQTAARHGALHASWRHRRRARRRHPALAAAGGRLPHRQHRQRAHPLSLPAHESEARWTPTGC